MATRELDRLFEPTEPAREAVPDRELTLSFQRGDKWAYDLIYRRYSPRVRMVCQRMLSDPQDAQDAAQETFLRVYQALPRFNGQYQLAAWISRIATNVCLDYLRSRNRTPYDSAPNELLEDCVEAEQGDTPEEALLRSVEGMRVHETLASLSPLHRRAITMRDLEGRDYSDIASSLGVPEAGARVLLHRARKGFRRSWTSAGIFVGLPARLLQRVRRLRGDPSVADSVVHAAGTTTAHASPTVASGAHLAASCSQVLQGCTNVVSERIAAAATAALVGVGVTAAGGASTSLSAPTAEVRPPALAVPDQLGDHLSASTRGLRRVARATAEAFPALATVSDSVAAVAEDVAEGAASAVGVESDSESTPASDEAAPGEATSDASSPSGSDATTSDAGAGSADGGPTSSEDSTGAATDANSVPAEDVASTPTPDPSAATEDDSTSVPDATEAPVEAPVEETTASAGDASVQDSASEDESGEVLDDPFLEDASTDLEPTLEISPTPEPTPTPSAGATLDTSTLDNSGQPSAG